MFSQDPLEQAKQIKIQQVYAISAVKQTGGIEYTAMSSTVFNSNGYSANAIISYQIAGMTPIGFTVPDIDGNFVVVSLEQLLALNTGVVDLQYLAQLNAIILINSIELLTTAEEVEEFDINT